MTPASPTAAAICDDASRARALIQDALAVPTGDSSVADLRRALKRADRIIAGIATRARSVVSRERAEAKRAAAKKRAEEEARCPVPA